MLDPAAQEGARVWVRCPACKVQPSEGCYLLGYDVADVFCQCPRCEHRFYVSTGFGVGDNRPEAGAEWYPYAS